MLGQHRAGVAGGDDELFLVLAHRVLFRYLGSGRHLDLDLSYLCQEAPLGMPHALDLGYPYLAGETVCMGVFPTDQARSLAPPSPSCCTRQDA